MLYAMADDCSVFLDSRVSDGRCFFCVVVLLWRNGGFCVPDEEGLLRSSAVLCFVGTINRYFEV